MDFSRHMNDGVLPRFFQICTSYHHYINALLGHLRWSDLAKIGCGAEYVMIFRASFNKNLPGNQYVLFA